MDMEFNYERLFTAVSQVGVICTVAGIVQGLFAPASLMPAVTLSMLGLVLILVTSLRRKS